MAQGVRSLAQGRLRVAVSELPSSRWNCTEWPEDAVGLFERRWRPEESIDATDRPVDGSTVKISKSSIRERPRLSMSHQWLKRPW